MLSFIPFMASDCPCTGFNQITTGVCDSDTESIVFHSDVKHTAGTFLWFLPYTATGTIFLVFVLFVIESIIQCAKTRRLLQALHAAAPRTPAALQMARETQKVARNSATRAGRRVDILECVICAGRVARTVMADAMPWPCYHPGTAICPACIASCGRRCPVCNIDYSKQRRIK